MIYIVRFVEFLLRKLLAVAIVALLLVFAFYFGMNASNLYILAKEGLNMRAEVVLTGQGQEELSKFFTAAFLNSDARLQDRTYENFTVRTFNHRMGLSWISYLPWKSDASLFVVERITYIDGELPEEKKSDEQLALKKRILPPDWGSTKLALRFVKQDQMWKIDAIEIQEELAEPTAVPMVSSPQGTATPPVTQVPQ